MKPEVKVHTAVDLDFNYKPFVRQGLMILFITFAIMIGWSAFAPLKSAVVSNGQLSVASKNKIVQHLDGGEVTHIAVKEGDWVEQGELLLRLDSNFLKIRQNNMQEQIFGLAARIERLIVERDGHDDLHFSQDLRLKAETRLEKEILLTQKNLFNSRRKTLHSEQNVLSQRLIQYSKQSKGLELQSETIHARLKLLKQDIAGLQTLVGKKFVAKVKLRELMRNQSRLMGELFSNESEISRLAEIYVETKHLILLKGNEYTQEVISLLSEHYAQQNRLHAEYMTVNQKLLHIDIKAPVSGKIKDLDIVTVGQILKSGEEIMQIVPADRDFIIQAQISPMDIDVLKIGQKAEMRFSVFEQSNQMPPLYGIVHDISNDVYENVQQQQVFYKANLVLTNESMLILDEYKQTLVSGMPVEVMIQTGKRTVLGYMLKPIKDMLARAFNEA